MVDPIREREPQLERRRGRGAAVGGARAEHRQHARVESGAEVAASGGTEHETHAMVRTGEGSGGGGGVRRMTGGRVGEPRRVALEPCPQVGGVEAHDLQLGRICRLGGANSRCDGL